jgi:hypothetical protein
VILDDVLSGIDASTENHIFHSLFGRNGLLPRLRSTVLFASSSGVCPIHLVSVPMLRLVLTLP